MSAPSPSRSSGGAVRAAWWVAAAAVVAFLVYLMATASTGPVDPTEAGPDQSHTSVVVNSAIIVFREGLEAVLIFAAVTAAFLGTNRRRRRPVVLGAATAFGATVVTWFLVKALLDAASPLGPRLEAITGFLAIVVLLLVLNWFVHKVYWSEWIGRHHRAGAAAGVDRARRDGRPRGARLHERLPRGRRDVLFLQNLELQAGSATVARGRRDRAGRDRRRRRAHVLAASQAPLPAHARADRRARGRRARRDDRRDGADLPGPRLAAAPRDAVHGPRLDGRLVRDVLDLGDARALRSLAALLVVGSYFAAEYVKVTRPRRRGAEPARRAVAPPAAEPA
jgi:high-affinity iron transporter